MEQYGKPTILKRKSKVDPIQLRNSITPTNWNVYFPWYLIVKNQKILLLEVNLLVGTCQRLDFQKILLLEVNLLVGTCQPLVF